MTPLNEGEQAKYTFSVSFTTTAANLTLSANSRLMLRFPNQFDSSHLSSTLAQCLVRYKVLNPVDSKLYDLDKPLRLSVLNNELTIFGFEDNDVIPSDFKIILFDITNPNIELDFLLHSKYHFSHQDYVDDSTYTGPDGSQIKPVSLSPPLHLKDTQRTSGNLVKIFAIGFAVGASAEEVTHVSQGIALPGFTSAPFALNLKTKIMKNNEKRRENDFSFEIYSDLNPIPAATQGGRLKIKFPREFHVDRRRGE